MTSSFGRHTITTTHLTITTHRTNHDRTTYSCCNFISLVPAQIGTCKFLITPGTLPVKSARNATPTSARDATPTVTTPARSTVMPPQHRTEMPLDGDNPSKVGRGRHPSIGQGRCPSKGRVSHFNGGTSSNVGQGRSPSMHAYYIMSVRLDICHNSSSTGTKTLPVLVPMVPVLINSLVNFVERINELATAAHPCHYTRL